MPDLRAHGAWINPTTLPITSSNFHAVHALKRTHAHTFTHALPAPSPSLRFPKILLRKNGSKSDRRRQAGRQTQHAEWPTEEAVTHRTQTHTQKYSQADLEGLGLTRAHTHTHTLKKAWNKTFHPACCWWQLFYFWYCDFYPVISIAF